MTTVLLTGTGTEVGKTWWGRATIETLVAGGVPVAARKPVQSYAPGELGQTDAEILGRASGEPVDVVCPPHRWYALPMAPPMAADALGLPPFTIADLVTELAPSPDGSVTIIEGAGGPRSPLAADGDTITLARAVSADLIVLVAPAGLGTINAVRLSTDTLRAALGDDTRLVVALNYYDGGDDLHRRNHGWLAGLGLPLVLAPAELATLLTLGASESRRSEAR